MDANTANDESIIEHILAGNVEAYAWLVQRHQNMVHNYLWRMTNHAADVEDLAQDVFVRAYQHLGKFDPTRNVPFSAWLIHIARNICLNHLRKQTSQQHVQQHYTLAQADGEDAEQTLHRERMSTHLQSILADITPEMRETFILKEVNGFPVNTIANIQHIAVGTVKSRLSRLREKLSSERDIYDV